MIRNEIVNLNEDTALVLQQIRESGEEDFVSLSQMLRISHRRLATILDELRIKELVQIKHSMYSESVIRLSAKGNRLINYLWPIPSESAYTF